MKMIILGFADNGFSWFPFFALPSFRFGFLALKNPYVNWAGFSTYPLTAARLISRVPFTNGNHFSRSGLPSITFSITSFKTGVNPWLPVFVFTLAPPRAFLGYRLYSVLSPKIGIFIISKFWIISKWWGSSLASFDRCARLSLLEPGIRCHSLFPINRLGKQNQEKKCTLRCALYLLFWHGEKTQHHAKRA